MPSFGKDSADKLAQCHPDLQRLFNEVVKTYDCSILTGHRGQKEQDEAVAKGLSKTPWPTGNHNATPSNAVDAAPYPIKWGATGDTKKDSKQIARFYHFAGFVQAKAEQLGIKIRFGGDWDRDGDFEDQSFDDLDHFEIVKA